MRRLICAFVVRIWQKQVFSQMFFSVIPAIRGGCPGLGRQVEQNQCSVWCVDRRTETLGLSGGYLYWQCRYQTPAACGNFKIPGVSGWRFLKNFISQKPGAVARSDAHPSGMQTSRQTVAGLILMSGKTFFRWDLVMKKFLQPSSLFCPRRKWPKIVEEP